MMDKNETKRRMDMIRLELRGVASDLASVGKLSDHVYQAKCDRYANTINELVVDILKDEMTDIE